MVREFLLRDDLDGTTENIRNLTYTTEGQDYEIDLSEHNIQRFHEALEPFFSKSRELRRQTGTTRRRGGGRRQQGRSTEEVAEIREWARQNGHEVADRGRIPKNVLEAYEAEQSEQH